MVTEAVLIDAGKLAVVLGVSLRTVRAWDASGLLPQRLQIGRTVRWQSGEIERWIAAGCPTRAASAEGSVDHANG